MNYSDDEGNKNNFYLVIYLSFIIDNTVDVNDKYKAWSFKYSYEYYDGGGPDIKPENR